MNTEQLEIRWKSITNTGISPYRSLRISSSSIPEIYLALNTASERFLILQVPERIQVNCRTVTLENLSIEWHAETRFILIGLHNQRFSDLFNDLTLSLYNRTKDSTDPGSYTDEFVQTFYRWAAFFESSWSGLSENTLKGLFGELTLLRWYLKNDSSLAVNTILEAWRGPYHSAQDFIFTDYNLEVKTKDSRETNVWISSEFQLESENSKGLQLGIVNILSREDGLTLSDLMLGIIDLVNSKNGDLVLFNSAIDRMGFSYSTAENYNAYKWKPENITFYDCCMEGFPKITSTNIAEGLSQIKYSLNTVFLDSFIIQRIILTWS